MIYTEYYTCRYCEASWLHHWDTEDRNNDYTICPNCNEVDFTEIEEHEFFELFAQKDDYNKSDLTD